MEGKDIQRFRKWDWIMNTLLMGPEPRSIRYSFCRWPGFLGVPCYSRSVW